MGATWEGWEVGYLRVAYEDGDAVRDIARQLGRSIATIHARASMLGIRHVAGAGRAGSAYRDRQLDEARRLLAYRAGEIAGLRAEIARLNSIGIGETP